VRVATAKIKGVSPYSQSAVIDPEKFPKKQKESSADYESRIWPERMHRDKDGFVIIPPMVFKNAISDAAKYLAMQIPGKGKATYTKHFEAGVLILDPSPLGVKAEDVQAERLFVPASGRRGDGKRVWKYFPFIPEWETEVVFHIADDTITKDVFQYHLEQAGKFIGIGRFRPRNNGFYGRFVVESIQWSE